MSDKRRFVALYTVGIDIKADTIDGARAIAKDFRRYIDAKAFPVDCQDDTMTVVVNKVYEP